MIIAFIFLFYNIFVYADVDVKDIQFKFTCYSPANTNDHSLGAAVNGRNITYEDCTLNSKYNWYEYNYNGTNYVVLAAATNELLKSGELASEGVTEQSHIHYFNYFDTFKFKFSDSSFDQEEYYGIILDSCGASMKVKEGDPQILDVYISGSNEDCNNSSINQKLVQITDSNGNYGANAGTSSSSTTRNWLLELLGSMFSLPADFINIGLNMPQKWGKYSILNAYDKTYIDDHKKIAKKLDVSESTTEEGASNSSDKILKVANISSTIDNRKGEKSVVFSSSTQIPYMPIDAYSMVIGKVKTFDIDFFSNSKTNSSLKKVVKAGSHVVLYISAAALLTMIIWRGILVVMSTLGQNPVQATESRMIIDNAVKAIALLAGIYVIIILMQEGYTLLSNALLNGNKEEFPIRMNVEGVCSFNTNLIGYFKYLSLSSDSLAGLAYSMAYLGMSLISLTCFVFMLARTLIVAALTIFAPVTAIYAIAQRTPTSEASLGNVFILRNFLGILFRWIYAPIITIAIIKFMFYVL